MTVKEKLRAEAAIRHVVRTEGRTKKEVRQSMQEALDDAWSTAWQPGNLRAQLRWQQLFPGCRKPTVEEFIAHLSQHVSEETEGGLAAPSILQNHVPNN